MRWVRRVMVALLALVVLGVGGMAVRFYVLLPKARAAPNLSAKATPDALERGRYLFDHVAACAGCHSKVDEGAPGEPVVEGHLGEGRDFGRPPGFPGHIRGSNITPDKETGLGSWTDGQIARAIREGVSKDGRVLFNMMPYTTYAASLSDDDVLAVIAYMRTLAPIKNDAGICDIDFPVSMFIRAVPQPLTRPPGAAPANGMERGNWLLQVASCHDCHDTVNERHEPIPGKSLAGGNPFPIPGKGTVFTTNITSDQATGIGAYSDEDLLRAIDQGIGKNGRQLYGMPWRYYKGMTDADKRALILALRAVKPVVNAVPPPDFK